jgi:hypothetical protein
LNKEKKMKKIIEVTEVSGEGLESLLGQKVMLFCLNYIYAGELTGVNSSFVQLTKAHIVYETGSFEEKGYKDAQKLPGDVWYVQVEAIESFGVGK